jgi:hypothetical protein
MKFECRKTFRNLLVRFINMNALEQIKLYFNPLYVDYNWTNNSPQFPLLFFCSGGRKP